MKKRLLILMLVIVAVMASACSMSGKKSGSLGQNAKKQMNVSYNTQKAMPNQMKVADIAAQRVTNLKEVRSASVIVTNHNAYVAAILEGGTNAKLNAATEQKISQQVKLTDRSIAHVYVSTNPGFVQHMKRYAADIRTGHPVAGLFNEFTQMIKRIFPTQH